jgi:hypothetical protein
MGIDGGDAGSSAVERAVVPLVDPLREEEIGEETRLVQPSTSDAVASTSDAVASTSDAVASTSDAVGSAGLELDRVGDLEAGGAGVVPEEVEPQRSARGGLLGIWDRFVAIGGDRSRALDDPSSADGVDAVTGSDVEHQAGGSAVSSNAVCLICLEPLSQAEFESGEGMTLECGCRGDLAVRHRACAIKWSQVKDDGRGGLPQCELCRKPVKNLPELPRRPEREDQGPARQPGDTVLPVTMEDAYLSDPSQFEHFVPSRADLMFDCVRVTWIAMIVSILFFDANMGLALCTGAVAGMAYLLMLRVLYRQHLEAMRSYAESQRTTRMIIRI